ncbi:MAG TPA: EF-P lysine aminoacylase EpmA [Polyangiales bacterium]|nr:EF-P lysine aminoacylase EpmA [Polyangiales bacterium]
MLPDRTPIAALAEHPETTPVCVAGRIVAQWDDAALLRDESGVVRLLVTAPIALNALAFARGQWNGKAVEVTEFELLRPAPGEVRELTELAKQDNQKQRRLFARARIASVVRDWFDERGFLEVETPLVVPSPGLDVHLDALSVQTRAGERFLITSPEYQMKRLLAGGLEHIYQFAKCFRNDELGERHQPEFTMLEWYRAYSGVEAMMRDTEELVCEVAYALHGKPFLETAKGKVDVEPPWPRITVREAFARFAQVDVKEIDDATFYQLLVDKVEPALAELGALFLTEYPARMASLARKKPDDDSVAERFEAYVSGVELCNGFGELTDPDEQRARLLADQEERTKLGKPVYPIDERFLTALVEGIPPSGGNALGFDRLLMLALGAHSIEDVIALPASRI